MVNLKSEKGQGLVEYGLLIVLIGILVLVVLTVLGPIIGNAFTEINSELENVTYLIQTL